jgi:hypothetical protein
MKKDGDICLIAPGSSLLGHCRPPTPPHAVEPRRPVRLAGPRERLIPMALYQDDGISI